VNISDAGLEFIKGQEACRLDAYLDQRGVWTLGWGHTGQEVQADMRITQAQADKWLMQDLEAVQKCVNNSVSVRITQSQFDALCSFTFNCGCIALRNSTLLRKLNAGDDAGAATEFHRWDHADGRVLAVLTKRRTAEAEMFLA
jgi:lysozyme